MSKPLLIFVSLLLSTSIAIAGCAPISPETSPTQPTPTQTVKIIRIATQSPLSGDQAALGTDIERGAELALEQLSGPLNQKGFRVELVPFDDQADPDAGVKNARQIVSDPDILCGVGHLNSGVMIPSSEEYHNASLAFVSPANTNPKVTDRGYLEVSRIVGRDDIQGVVGADFAAAKGIKSVFIIHDTTPYGLGVAEYFQTEAQAKGMRVVGFEGTLEKRDFTELVNKIIAINPDMVYFGGTYAQPGPLFQQAREKGYMGIFMGPDALGSPELMKFGGPALVDGGGLYYSTVAGPAPLYPGTIQFIEDFKAKYGSTPQPFAAQGYDAMAICLKALENAVEANNGQTPTRTEVAHQIRALTNFPGITGTFTFNDIGDPTMAKYFVLQVKQADPARWDENPVIQALDIAPPTK